MRDCFFKLIFTSSRSLGCYISVVPKLAWHLVIEIQAVLTEAYNLAVWSPSGLKTRWIFFQPQGTSVTWEPSVFTVNREDDVLTPWTDLYFCGDFADLIGRHPLNDVSGRKGRDHVFH